MGSSSNGFYAPQYYEQLCSLAPEVIQWYKKRFTLLEPRAFKQVDSLSNEELENINKIRKHVYDSINNADIETINALAARFPSFVRLCESHDDFNQLIEKKISGPPLFVKFTNVLSTDYTLGLSYLKLLDGYVCYREYLAWRNYATNELFDPRTSPPSTNLGIEALLTRACDIGIWPALRARLNRNKLQVDQLFINFSNKHFDILKEIIDEYDRLVAEEMESDKEKMVDFYWAAGCIFSANIYFHIARTLWATLQSANMIDNSVKEMLFSRFYQNLKQAIYLEYRATQLYPDSHAKEIIKAFFAEDVQTHIIDLADTWDKCCDVLLEKLHLEFDIAYSEASVLIEEIIGQPEFKSKSEYKM